MSATGVVRGFKVYRVDTDISPVPACGRRDFCGIYLLTGQRRLRGADREIALDGTCLFFSNSHAAGASARAAARQTGYACLFTQAFVQENGHARSGAQWSMFHGTGTRALSLPDELAAYLTAVFGKMLAEQWTTHLFKRGLLGSHLQLVIHEALRLRAQTLLSVLLPATASNESTGRQLEKQTAPLGVAFLLWGPRPPGIRSSARNNRDTLAGQGPVKTV